MTNHRRNQLLSLVALLMVRMNNGFAFLALSKCVRNSAFVSLQLAYLPDNEELSVYSRSNKNNFQDECTNPISCFSSGTKDHDTSKVNFVGAGTLGDIMSTPDEFSANPNAYFPNNESNETRVNGGDTTKLDGDMLNSTHANSLNDTKMKKSRLDSGLVTTTGGTLQAEFSSKMHGHISPLERIAITANGNLQRIFSSYYDAPVHVIVDKCQLQPSNILNNSYHPSSLSSSDKDQTHSHSQSSTSNTMSEHIRIPAVWDRSVHLSVHDQKFCTAFSQITVHSQECVDLVCSGKVGIGQIFRYLNKLPTFQLLDAGRSHHGGIWREYSLSCDELTCQIREEFTSNAWNILPQ